MAQITPMAFLSVLCIGNFIFLTVFVHFSEVCEVHLCDFFFFFFDVSTVTGIARDTTEIGCQSFVTYTIRFNLETN